jgi:hypothetical protein
MAIQALFSPIRVGNVALKHRVVLAPLTRFRNSKTHTPNDLVVEYYKQRAGNGGGLLITEATFISAMGGGYPGAPGIFSQEQVEGWKKVRTHIFTVFGPLIHCINISSQRRSPRLSMPKDLLSSHNYGMLAVLLAPLSFLKTLNLFQHLLSPSMTRI